MAIEVRGRGSGRLRLAVLPDAKSASLSAFVTASNTTGEIVHTDGWQGYERLGSLGFAHRPLSQSAALPGEQLLPRAHRAIGNLKAWMHGTHRGVSPDHLPAYLDEFARRDLHLAALRDRFNAAQDAAGVSPRRELRQLRNTFGTVMAAAGAPLRTIQEWMGHENMATTERYASHMPRSKDAALVSAAFAVSAPAADGATPALCLRSVNVVSFAQQRLRSAENALKPVRSKQRAEEKKAAKLAGHVGSCRRRGRR